MKAAEKMQGMSDRGEALWRLAESSFETNLLFRNGMQSN